MRTRSWKAGIFAGIGFMVCLMAGASLPARSLDCAGSYKSSADRYYLLQKSSQLTPENCRALMDEFELLASTFPDCHKADDALYMVGMLGMRAGADGGGEEDLRRALLAFRRLTADYPDSSLADDAQYYVGEIYMELGEWDKAEQSFRRVLDYRGGDMNKKARDRLVELPARKAEAEKAAESARANRAEAARREEAARKAEEERASTNRIPAPVAIEEEPVDDPAADPAGEPVLEGATAGIEDIVGAVPAAVPDAEVPVVAEAGTAEARLQTIRYWSNQDYTRVVVELDRQVPYQPPHLLKPDPALGTPPRLYLDFQGTILSASFRREFPYKEGCYHLPIGDGLLRKARAGQYQPDVARIVLDIERIDHFRAFPLPGEPFRYVIDVYGVPAKKSPGVARVEPDRSVPEAPAPSTGGGKKILIVLDPGHGGKDPGAVGPSGVYEKDITLALAKRTRKTLLARRSDVKVVLTREDDRYLSLVERTAMANTLGADLFVSIHCNAAKSSQAYGIETYYLDNTTDRASLRLAAKENFVPEEKMTSSSDTTNLILADLITASKVEDSVPLARYLQQSMIDEVGRRYADISDHGVKKAPFWVLTGATMPCALVEVSFISNPREEKRLTSAAYQQALADSISLGIAKYLDNYHLVSMAR